MLNRPIVTAGLFLCLLSVTTVSMAGQLLVSAATADITPPKPAALDGQFGLRVSQKADTPITANVLVLESKEGDRSLDTAVMVSCDLVVISDIMYDNVCQATKKRLPDFDLKKMFLNATHTHTAPVTRPGIYDIPKEGVIQPEEYCAFAADRIAEAIERAWKARKPGSFTWGLGHAAVAENRRATYADGRSVMYGQTNQPDFRGLEGYVDHDIGSMFFWDEAGKLIAMTINVVCPSQEVEGLSSLNADFWHPVREMVKKRYGADVCVLGWTGAAGDLSPHPMIGKGPVHQCSTAEDRMRELRKLSRLEEIARRIVAAVDETYETVKNDRRADAPLIHKTEMVRLPVRLVTDAEYAAIKAEFEREKPTNMAKAWNGRVLERYEEQKKNPHPTRDIDIHVIRIGDAVVCTNTFELFTDYGIQMKARSRANQTFVIQLASGGEFCYLPTERAARGGGYSAIVQSNTIGPEGGQVLVNRTVELIDSLWANPTEVKK